MSIRSESVDVGGTGLVRRMADVRMTGCSVIFTEGLNDGQKYGDVVAENPFRFDRRVNLEA